jgi:hypothetical protein
MIYLWSLSRVHKLCTLLGASLVLPILAYAGTDHGKGNDDYNNGKQNGRDKIHSVPEGGPGIVLSIATIGAVLLFSRRGYLSANLAKNNGDQFHT